MSIVKLPSMEKREIDNLIKEQIICRISFKGDRYPYTAPFQYVFMNDTLYFHFTDYGRKMKFIEENKQVCVEIEKFRPDLSEYSFVVLRGTLEVVTVEDERAKVVKRMAEEGKRRLSVNFLAAHGLRKEEGWSSLTPEKPLVIVKLGEIAERMGLKSS
nr:pyridoxamine 5'-phosphate oxidase family protein [Candidatus Njordarchaeum guaymaensis]